jgi:hypothetical protein
MPAKGQKCHPGDDGQQARAGNEAPMGGQRFGGEI